MSIHPTSKNRVFVIETWLKNPGRWYTWSAHTGWPAACQQARDLRAQYPGHKFRVTKYVSTKP